MEKHCGEDFDRSSPTEGPLGFWTNITVACGDGWLQNIPAFKVTEAPPFPQGYLFGVLKVRQIPPGDYEILSRYLEKPEWPPASQLTGA
jgi:hypothetical protein